MKTIRKIIVLGLLSLALIGKIFGQEEIARASRSSNDYKNAVGLRAGETSGFTYKHKFKNKHAFEGILGTFPYAFSFTALYEKYVPTGVNGLQIYFGGGGHVANQFVNTYGYYFYNEGGRYYYYRTYSYGPAIGIDGMTGVEYKLPRVPIIFSFDLKPNIEFVPEGGTYGSIDPGLGIKFGF